MLVVKYRPKKLDGIVGRDAIVNAMRKYIKSPDGIPHLLFTGNPGGGKTLMAEVIGNEIYGADAKNMVFVFNASVDRGIDIIRNQVLEIAKLRPIMGHSYKILFFDESDAMTPDSQTSMRRIIEQYSSSCRFIFACNYRHKLIPAIISRCVEYQFLPFDTEFVAKYLKAIVKKENLPHTDRDIISLAGKSNGDLRKALNLLEGIAQESDGMQFWEEMTVQKFSTMSKEEKINLSFQMDPEMIFNGVYEFMKREKQYQWVPLLADCQAKMNFSLQKTIFITDLLSKI